MVQRRLSERLDLYFPTGEEATADLVAQAVARSLAIIREKWGLPDPPRCRIYVMTGWLPFMFHSAPWYALPGLVLFLPVWALRTRRRWPVVAGWALGYRRRPTVGIKPPWLLEKADRTIGKLIFTSEPDLHEKTELTTCHELTHAFTAYLRLPAWLNEGIALLSTDAYLGQRTVLAHTLQMLPTAGGGRPRQYRGLLRLKAKALAGQYARAYWVTRYLNEKHPALLKSLLERRARRRSLEGRVAGGLGVARRNLWSTVDQIVTAHFAPLVGACDCDSCLRGEGPGRPHL